MAESETKSAALWLGKLLLEEMKYLGGVRDKVENLQTELDALAGFLIEAVKRRHQDNVVRNAVLDGREVAYDCQDVIETYILKVARHGYEEYTGCQLGTLLRWACIATNALPLHEIRSQIDELNGRITALKSKMQSYGVPQRIADESNLADGLTDMSFYPHARDEYVVGLDKDLGKLVNVLLDPTYSDQTVIAIHGMGGIGKSTLARELYYHTEIRKNFEAFAWVGISRQFQRVRKLENLIYQLVPENDDVSRQKVEQKIRSEQAHEALYNLMQETKCLVVVDDIWSSDDWAKLEKAFPRGKDATGSRILLTTRKEESIKKLDPNLVYPHKVQGLDNEKSWELFEKTTSPLCTDPGMEKLGREMLTHCGGVPLAIVVLGKALKKKQTEDNWKEMHNNISAQIQSGKAPSDLYKDVYDVLRVSYDELPSHLKHCFLHLANFPEDFKIPADKLFQLWVGEGIVIKEDSNEQEEDIAERYLNELVKRSMVQVGSWAKDSRGTRIETCHLHDLMRDICIEMANKESFLRIINCKRPKMLMASLPEIDKRLRRLAVYISNPQPEDSTSDMTSPTTDVLTPAKLSSAPHLRSLLLFPLSGQCLEEDCEEFMKSICKDFPLLRIIDCGNFDFKGKLPQEIGDLIHLRYLGLGDTLITELPSSIDKLQCLQTLDLRVNARVKISIPNILWKMKQLRHLYLPCWEIGVLAMANGLFTTPRYSIKGGGKLQLKGLQNLQKLVNIDLDRVDLQGLFEFRSMKTLSATCDTNKEALNPFLQMSSMKSFALRLNAQIMNEKPMILSSCESMYELDIYAKGSHSFSLSEPLCLKMFPKGLVCLRIWGLMLAEDPLPVLEKLPNLVDLELIMCYRDEKMVCSAGGFPKLNHVDFHSLYRFSCWEVKEGAMPNLKTVRLINCRVTKVPDTLPSSVIVTIWPPPGMASTEKHG